MDVPMLGRRPPDNKPTWVRFSSVGIEFAIAVAGFALVGYWIDSHYGSEPWGVIIGAALGLLGGSYNLIRESMAAFKSFEKDTKPKNGPDDQD